MVGPQEQIEKGFHIMRYNTLPSSDLMVLTWSTNACVFLM